MRTLYALLTLLLTLPAFSQCTNVQIFPTSVVVNTDQTIDVPFGGTFWVCSGITATFTGMGYIINIEPNSNVTLNGSNGIVYAEEGCSIVINGTLNAVIHDPAATVTDNGTNSTVQPCPGPLNYDYSNTPVGGCPVGIDETEEDWTLDLYLDPNSGIVTINSEGATIRTIEVYSLNGTLVPAERISPNAIDMRGHSLGTYFFRIESDKGTVTKRLTRM